MEWFNYFLFLLAIDVTWYDLWPVPLMVWAGGHSNDDLPGEGRSTVAIQHHLPVVDPMGEDCVGTNTDPCGILTNADSVAIVGEAGLRVFQVSIP